MEWTDMVRCQQQMQKLMLALLPALGGGAHGQRVRASGLPVSAAGPQHAGPAQPGERDEKRGGEPLPESAL